MKPVFQGLLVPISFPERSLEQLEFAANARESPTGKEQSMRILLIALVVSVLISLAAGGLDGLAEFFGSRIAG